MCKNARKIHVPTIIVGCSHDYCGNAVFGVFPRLLWVVPTTIVFNSLAIGFGFQNDCRGEGVVEVGDGQKS